MEIDITDFVHNNDAHEYFASAMELGQDAGRITWGNAMEEAARKPMLATAEQIQELRDHMTGYGAWDDDKIAAWSADECNALFIQEVSAAMREADMDDSFPDEFDWSAYARRCEEGQISGRIFRCDIKDHASYGRIFYYLGN